TRTGIRNHRNEVGSLRIGFGDRRANRRSELPAPVIELVAMQPVAQRDLARLRTRRLALRHYCCLLRRAPTSPSRCPSQHFNATETVPINWQLTWHTIPLPRSNKAGSPHCRHPTQGGGRAPLTKKCSLPLSRCANPCVTTTWFVWSAGIGGKPYAA